MFLKAPQAKENAACLLPFNLRHNLYSHCLQQTATRAKTIGKWRYSIFHFAVNDLSLFTFAQAVSSFACWFL